MWERGIRESGLGRRLMARWFAGAAIVAAMVVLTALAGRPAGQPVLGLGASSGSATAEATTGGEATTGTGATGTATSRPDAIPGDTPQGYTLDGTDPEGFPEDRAGLAFLELDASLEAAREEFGPPHARQPDINDTTANVWSLPGDAELVAVTAGEDAGDPVVGLSADVPSGSAVRLAAHAGVVIGRSTPAEIVEAWGPGYDRSRRPGDDFVIRYVLCRGGWPVVVKFDQPEGASWDDDPVTRMFLAYTDDDPGICAAR